MVPLAADPTPVACSGHAVAPSQPHGRVPSDHTPRQKWRQSGNQKWRNAARRCPPPPTREAEANHQHHTLQRWASQSKPYPGGGECLEVHQDTPTIVDPITAKESAIYKKKIFKHIFVFAGYHYLQVQGGGDGDILCPIVRQPVPWDVGESLWRAKPFLYLCHFITWHRYINNILLVWGGPMTVSLSYQNLIGTIIIYRLHIQSVRNVSPFWTF